MCGLDIKEKVNLFVMNVLWYMVMIKRNSYLINISYQITNGWFSGRRLNRMNFINEMQAPMDTINFSDDRATGLNTPKMFYWFNRKGYNGRRKRNYL